MWGSRWLLQMVHSNPNLLVAGALNRFPFFFLSRTVQAVWEENTFLMQLFDFKGDSFKVNQCVQHRIGGLEVICMFNVKPVEHYSSWRNPLWKYEAGVRRQSAKPGAASMALSMLATIAPASVTQSNAPFNIFVSSVWNAEGCTVTLLAIFQHIGINRQLDQWPVQVFQRIQRQLKAGSVHMKSNSMAT